MPISTIGQVNISALNVPDTYVQIVPPQFLFSGVSTNKGGFVGTASWGPVGTAQNFANYSQYQSIYGPTINRLYDMGGHVILATAQGGAGSLYGVRVTDGTDVAASVLTAAGGLTFTGKYTGSLGNQAAVTISVGSQAVSAVSAVGSILFVSNPSTGSTITLNGQAVTFLTSGAVAASYQVNLGANLAATLANLLAFLQTSVATSNANLRQFRYSLAPGGTQLVVTAATPGVTGNSLTLATTVTGATVTSPAGGTASTPTYKVTVTLPNTYPEQFDNVGAGLTGNALLVAIASAVNSGNSTVRGPSNVVVASVGASTAAPVFGTYPLVGGTDGATSITTSTMLGVDGQVRSGMYSLRGTGVSQAMLCDLSDVNSLSTQVAFGVDVGCYMIATTPAGDSVSNAVNEVGNAGVDSFTIKVMFGDWVYWIDTTNNVPMRLSSPQSVAMGILCNLSPQGSSLNKTIQGIVGTQRSITGVAYSSADLQSLGQSQMDVVANPEPGGRYFACRFGKNASSNQVIFGDEYTRVTYFLAKSLLTIAGYYVGQTQTPDERNRATTSITSFLQLQVRNGIIGTADGSIAYQVTLDNTNNSQATVALGYQYAYVKVIYLGIVRYFIIDLEGGASVQISTGNPLTQ